MRSISTLRTRQKSPSYKRVLIFASKYTYYTLPLEIMKSKGCLFQFVNKQSHLFSLLGKVKYDILILEGDLLDPKDNEIYMQIKKYNPKIKIILITSGPGQSYVKGALDAGVYACMHKPVNNLELLTLLRYARR